MPAYSVELMDRDGSSLDELAGAQLQDVTWVNSGIGDMNFNMSQTDRRVADPILRRHEARLHIEGWPRGTEVPWQGPILTSSQDDKVVAFQCSTIEHYLQKRFIDFSSLLYDGSSVDADGNYVAAPPGFAGYEQVDIAWGLVSYAQGRPVANYTINNPDKDFRVDAATTASGKLRLRQYMREDHANILDLLNEFPTLVDFVTGAPNGFDWAIIPYLDGRRLFTTYAPQRGTMQTNLTLEYGRNIFTFKVNESMVNFAARAICTGGSDGDIKLENEWKDAAAAAQFGEDMFITSDGDQMDPDTLGAKARSAVQQRNHPIVDPELQAVRVPVELLGVLQPGDTVPVAIHRGRTNIEGHFRIQSIKWAVRPDVLQLTFYPTLMDAS